MNSDLLDKEWKEGSQGNKICWLHSCLCLTDLQISKQVLLDLKTGGTGEPNG